MRILLLLVLFLLSCAGSESEASHSLDLLLIEVDGLTTDEALAPALQAIAREGASMGTAYAPSPDPDAAHRSHRYGVRPGESVEGRVNLTTLLERSGRVVSTDRTLSDADPGSSAALLLRVDLEDLAAELAEARAAFELQGRDPWIVVVGLPRGDDPLTASRVRWVMSTPDGLPVPGRQPSGRPVSTIDLLPTIAALLDLDRPGDELAGYPLLPECNPRPVYVEEHEQGRLVGHGVIDGGWVLWRALPVDGPPRAETLHPLGEHATEERLVHAQLMQMCTYADNLTDEQWAAYDALTRLERLLVARE